MYNDTPLHYAAEFGHLSIVDFLVNHGANIHSKNNDDPFSCFSLLHYILLHNMII